MNKDEKTITELERRANCYIKPKETFEWQIAQRLRELTATNPRIYPDRHYGAALDKPSPLSDAARELADRLSAVGLFNIIKDETEQQLLIRIHDRYREIIAKEFQSALTAHGEAVRERIAEWIRTQRNDVPMTGEEAANAIRALNLTEAS